MCIRSAACRDPVQRYGDGSEREPCSDNVRRAIEVMTAWTVDPDKQFTWSRFVQNVTEEPDGAIQMLMGFVTLGGELLVGLEKATGSTAPWHLQQIAAKYA
jgi:hypothetical protein